MPFLSLLRIAMLSAKKGKSIIISNMLYISLSCMFLALYWWYTSKPPTKTYIKLFIAFVLNI